MAKNKSKKLWGGRFKKELHSTLKCFSYSLYVDGELFQAEIRVSKAHVRMLGQTGLMTAAESRRLVQALESIGKEFTAKDPHENPLRKFEGIEDVHTFIEMQLEKRVGSLAGKLHTGRSRNDLVVTSTLVYLKEKLPYIGAKIRKFQKALLQFSEKVNGVVIPGMTHLKRAQPVLWAHHLLAYVAMLERDQSRLQDALRRMDFLPLGAAALAGSGLPLDPRQVAQELGFSGLRENSMDAVSDRDFAAETLSCLSILWMHLSRLSEDFILWNSEAFGFVVLDDSAATGSSLMPQKKNPDVFELVRGRSGIIFGHLVSLLTLLKGLPLAYNRDLQEDKPALFDSLHKTALALEALQITVTNAEPGPGIEQWAGEEDFIYATDVLDYLVKKGLAFRDAHAAVGRLVRYALDRQSKLGGLSLEEFRKFSNKFGQDVFRLFDPGTSVSGKQTPGSTHPGEVGKWIRYWNVKFKKA